ncbi:hypothetical protein ANN_05531 [Periplaneta americana]|uniref:Uncharacterized protein n=1 Tax=Periplaneta americana TaxID=6978 RepID=A0ABQ8TBZ6_PERAM|nr:hypothetical protein ANN_05531 [Periplaneta americana]
MAGLCEGGNEPPGSLKAIKPCGTTLVAITAAILSGMLSTSLCRISTGMRLHFSCNMALSWTMEVGRISRDLNCRSKSSQSCSMGLRSGLCAGQSNKKEVGAVERMALDWNPQGSRTRGRPKNTWKRTVLEEIAREGKTWSEVKKLATNRVRWRHFVNALCSCCLKILGVSLMSFISTHMRITTKMILGCSWINETFPGRWIGRGGVISWPPKSPDLTPLDYWMWGWLKSEVYKSKVEIGKEFLARILLACSQVKECPNQIRSVTQQLYTRTAKCIEVDCGLFEHVL